MTRPARGIWTWWIPRGGVKLSLLGTLDRTSTPMGARKLRDWLLHPLCDLEKLLARQEVIAVLLQEPYLMSKLRESLKNVRDMERLTGRISQGAGNARDLQALASSWRAFPRSGMIWNPCPAAGTCWRASVPAWAALMSW